MVNDKCNDCYGLFYAISMFISPIIGSSLKDSFNYQGACDIVAMFNFAYAFILFFFNCGPMVFYENRKFEEKLFMLKNNSQKNTSIYHKMATQMRSKSSKSDQKSALSSASWSVASGNTIFGKRKVTKSHLMIPMRPSYVQIDSYRESKRNQVSLIKANMSLMGHSTN